MCNDNAGIEGAVTEPNGSIPRLSVPTPTPEPVPPEPSPDPQPPAPEPSPIPTPTPEPGVPNPSEPGSPDAPPPLVKAGGNATKRTTGFLLAGGYGRRITSGPARSVAAHSSRP